MPGSRIELAADPADAWPLISPFVSEQILLSVCGASGANSSPLVWQRLQSRTALNYIAAESTKVISPKRRKREFSGVGAIAEPAE
jgi:hypothetical protein